MKFQFADVPGLARFFGGSRDQSSAEVAPRAPLSGLSRLLRSGLFHAGWYAAAAGEQFADERAAGRHYLRRGMARGIMPHPLIESSALPADVAEAARAGSIDALLDHLQTPTAVSARLGALFDGRRSPGSNDAKLAHPGGALGLFLSRAQGSTPLPVPDGHPAAVPDLDTALRALTAAAAEHARQRRLVRGRSPVVSRPATGTADPGQGSASLPTVSVLMPIFASAGATRRLLDSVERQTHPDWEVLAVDPQGLRHDVALEPCAAEVARRSVHDARYRVVPGPDEGSDRPGVLRNLTLEASTGDLVALADPDVHWDPDFFAAAGAALTAGDASAVLAAVTIRADDRRARRRCPDPAHEAMLAGQQVHPGALLVRRRVMLGLHGFDDQLQAGEEQDLLLRLTRDVRVDACRPVQAGLAYGPPHLLDAGHLVALGRAWVDWDEVRASVEVRDPHLVSLVVPTHQDARMTIRAVTAVLRDAAAADTPVEVVIVDNGSRREVGLRLAAVFAAEGRVRRIRLPRDFGPAIGRNVGFAASRGSVVVMLANDTEVRAGWLKRLLPRLMDSSTRGVQALLLSAGDTIESAGAIFPPGGLPPRPFLVGHPPEDAQRMSARPFSAVTGTALALRAAEFAALEGFDPLLAHGWEDVDYCLRAVRRYGGGFAVEPTAWVTHHESRRKGGFDHVERDRGLFTERWRPVWPAADEDRYHELGFDLVPLTDEDPEPTAAPLVVRRSPLLTAGAAPRLRWGIKLPSTPGSWGDIWGDTYFADALARALRRKGQDVVTYRWGSHHSDASQLDDVTLGIRGLEVITPVQGKVNMLWVISHPDLVTPEELEGFDVVFASSVPWAESMSESSGREVLPLHQALDSDVLPGPEVPLGDGRVPVFVGGSNPPVRDRTSIHAVATAGTGLVVHGHGWEGSPVAPFVASTNVPPTMVPTLYRRHGLVLADHWPDMAASGFVANRVFEAVASGARVVSDPVTGIEELFGGAVQVYRSLDELRELCSPEGRVRWPEDDELERIALRCAEAHSFRQRADELLEVAIRHLGTART
jgi:O-antigen biosynthesis protein